MIKFVAAATYFPPLDRGLYVLAILGTIMSRLRIDTNPNAIACPCALLNRYAKCGSMAIVIT